MMSVRHLLELEKPFKTIVVKSKEELERAAGIRHDAIDKAHQVLAIIEDERFWHNLKQ